MHIETPKKQVAKSDKEVFEFLTDIKNFETLMPDNIDKFEVLDEHTKHIRNYHYEKKNQPKPEIVTAVEKMKENAATKKRYVLGELISNNTQCTICR